MSLSDDCRTIAADAKAASRSLATASPRSKRACLQNLADRLDQHTDRILAANGLDLAAAPSFGLSSAQIDRLRLTRERLAVVARGVRQIAELPEPVGRVISSTVQPSGLRIDKISVPLGVLLFLYESRPNVTVDAAGLAIKSGNAIILRGGKEAAHSNSALHSVIIEAIAEAGLPRGAVQLIATPDREAVGHLLQLADMIDLVIPRGGPALIERVSREARMPVMKHYQGICHVYVHEAADLAMARRIVVNAKCSRPGVCNAAECLLVDATIAERFLPEAAAELMNRGVELRGCPRTCRIVPAASPASEQDYATEYLDLILSVRVVDGIDAALSHISRFGSGHTEAIVTNDLVAARAFTAAADASAIMVNASTRFNDGFEFGLGAEIGISTDKFHARGPCGLNELTSYKYVVYGDGQVRG